MRKSLKLIIQTLFFLSFVFFSYGGVGVILNHYYQYNPDKISAEFESSLIYGIGSIVIGIIFLFLFWGLFKSKKWFLSLYWFSVCLYFILLCFILWPFASTHYFQDALFLIGAISIPILLGIYLNKYKLTDFQHKPSSKLSLN